MSSTRTLASYLSKIEYDDLPPAVVEKGKLAIVDAVGNCIGGYPIYLSKTFLELSKELGGGREQATLIGDGTKVSVPMAAFGNGALSTMLDYCDITAATAGGARVAWSVGRACRPGRWRSSRNLGEGADRQRGGRLRVHGAGASLHGHDY